jgi:hypothetical protein
MSGHVVPRWALVFAAALFLKVGRQLCLGVLGEYSARMYGRLMRGLLAHFVRYDSCHGEAESDRSLTLGAIGA